MAQPPHTAWYVATGPCTNAALLFAAYPEVAHHLAGLSIMGGAVGGGFCPGVSKEFGKTLGQTEGFGNETPWAEFNIYCDPEAAQAVFSNPIVSAKTTLVTLDLTHQCLATKEVRERLLQGNSEKPSQLRLFLHEILEFFAQSYVEWFEVYEGPPLHDPLAVAALFGYSSGIYEEDGDRYDVRVVTDGAHSPLDSVRGQVGRTVVTKVEAGPNGLVQGVRIPRKLHTGKFWDVLQQCAQLADEKISL
ncbi:Uridine nucleosidase 1 [Elasticomyces elasticus]|uniref:Uridine nucleosidase 1 n=1 Tax=Exophiala sideris TaxID=1016849 RepID=A0ABR0JSM2_9EURO|nr:Uridine nucleosidase 1 [Elasticomyces elasticus]KAK5040480.1 Uridine nucleosidase 1 [Exophiala sideris]KAK5043094.1 Uridine nucleosidase 1 [Exophiala sideris]KAK5068858.1 Uridine nucleosidase 1 [Exophiala sideris]KAK5186454.1 Uridine nucleosidase 1 [Eurotiomycetes sp. CCFEE 6388]